ncbi:NAD(P)-dependent oxidoreductase [Streptomyces sp. NBC_01362]|uniref:NAD-dependent epimerase/dehydratase family protein n=1 Tax=Streptomyces sp. NBC_01362 TaxID=2903839 RepID=UPI002E2F4632|nr:NAD(P)-dependent oxidoreductase [Streptomyces sp. NBC_01362]
MTTIAVTGASGFCGSHVAVTAAARGADVLCVGRRPGPVGRHVPWDAACEVPDLSGADLVVHCAAAVGDPVPGSPAEAAMHAVNVDGTARLLEAAAGRPVVWVSSASVYAPSRCSRITEEHPVGGHLNAYGRTKAAGEALALAAGAVVLRPRAVYGAADPHLVPRLLARVRRGLLMLPGPSVRLSLTAVENLTDACLMATGRLQHRRPRTVRPRRSRPRGPARPRRTRSDRASSTCARPCRGERGPVSVPSSTALGTPSHPLRRRSTGTARRTGRVPGT